MKRVWVLFLAGFALTVAVAVPVVADNVLQRPLVIVPNNVQLVPDEFIVRFKPSANLGELTSFSTGALGKLSGTARSELANLAAAFGVQKVEPLFPRAAARGITELNGYHRVKVGAGQSLDAAMQMYAQSPLVDHVEAIGIHPVYATPSDPYYDDPTIFPPYYQWGMNNAGDHDVDAPEAWDLETGDSTVILAILDTGIRYFHKDLGGPNGSYSNPTGAVNGNSWINWAEKNGSAGVDDDGNGYVDDWVGYDFVNGATPCWSGEDCNTTDNDPRDFNGHGTHCAGIAAAITNNASGVAGMAGGYAAGAGTYGNGVKVMACRIGWSGSYLGQEVGYVRMDFAASAFYYAADKGARIASCSWGSSNSGGIDAAITYFQNADGLVVHAAGNSNNQTADYLGGLTTVLNVAATDSLDKKASFSTYGTWVDVSAPGVAIISLFHYHADATNDYIAAMDGTSMATPYAAGVCALIRSAFPSYTRQQVFDRIVATTDNIDALNPSYAGKLGSGRINAYNAVQGAGPVPPVAQFVGSPTSGCAPLAVQFTDQSTGGPTSWSWDFGDGGTSTLQNPSHTYTGSGSFTVTLTATNAQGSDSEIKTNYIVVSTGSAPVADFVGSPLTGEAPLTVYFTDLSTNSPTSWSWTFGDGGTSTAQNPSHVYTSAGTYTVALTASNSCGSDGETKTGYITVSAPAQQCDDFADGNISNWLNKTGTWTATSGYMKGNSNTTNAQTTSPFGSFAAATLDADVRMNTGRSQRNARIIFAYTSSTAYRFIEGDDVNNRWRIYERSRGRNTVRATFNATINTAQWYHVTVTLAADGNCTLAVGGSTLGSYKFSSAVSGLVGCGFTKSNSDFDNFCVGSGGTLAEGPIVIKPILGSNPVPSGFALAQNYPNPFNAGTNISFTLAEGSDVAVMVYDLLGRAVRHLAASYYPEGTHTVAFDGTDDYGGSLASGIYFYRLIAKGFTDTKKMVLLK
ncbi:MAG: S8 family serine peptidase [Candidatus Zixiibacteriota bacterium]